MERRTALTLPLALTSTMSSQTNAKPRVAIAALTHESNSFNPAPTTLADFKVELPAPGVDLVAAWAKNMNEMAGFIAASQSHFTLIPLLYANATPKGAVSNEAFETLTGHLTRGLQQAGKLDGVYLALHGALFTEAFPQGDEEIVRRVRGAIGKDIPLVVTHDFHANISPEMPKYVNALVVYKTNPHLDTKERGMQAAGILRRTLNKEVKPVTVVVKPPMIYNIVFQHTESEPLQPIKQASIDLEKSNPKVLAASISGGYQYNDCQWMGPSVTVVTDNDPALAQREAQRLADQMWGTRDRIKLNLPGAATAVRDAMAATKFPVALFDIGDNIGGGSAGDSTFLLDELVRQKAQGWVMVIADPAAVEAAQGAGIGGAFDMPVGGKTDQAHGQPVRVTGIVKSLHLGQYIETAVRHGGRRYWDLGHAAVIQVSGSTPELESLLLVTAKRSSPDSLNQLISCGIYPERQRILVAKGTVAPRAAYEPVAAKIQMVDTPGATSVNPARYTFKRLRPGLFGVQ